MSRSVKSGLGRSGSQSAGVAAAQAIAAQQMALTQGFGVGGTSLASTALRSAGGAAAASRLAGSTGALQTRPLSRTAPRRPAPRGSAAPADGGAIDLSSFTGASAAHFGQTGLATGAGIGTGDADLAAPAALENEYIVNLQQQVYFLELELNLMKKAGGGGGSTNPTGLRGSGAPSDGGGGSGGAGSGSGSGFTDANVPDAPLDDVMLSLREKYVQMESEYKKEQEELRAESADLRSRARMRELEIGNLKALHASLAAESERWKAAAQDHQSTLLDHQLANEQMILKLTNRLGKREKKLEKVQEELVHLRAEHRVAADNYADERAAYTAKWEERERKMDELNESYLAEKEKNLEWEQRFRQSNEAALIAQVQQLQQEALGAESALKKAELGRVQAEKNKASALESLDQIMVENESLRAAVVAMENTQRDAQAKEARDRASKSFWSSEVAAMQSQIVALTEKVQKLTSKYGDAKTLKKQLKDELVKSRVYIDELQRRLEEEADAHNKSRSSEEELNDLNREMKRDLTIKTEELQTLMARFKEVRAEADAAARARDQLHVQLTELQGQFDVTQALQQLKLHEFVSMAHSNLKVAGAIENLMGKMKKGDADTKDAQRRERHQGRVRDEELYSDSSSTTGTITPRHGSGNGSGGGGRRDRERDRERERADRDRDHERDFDSRPSTQESDLTNDTDSRPQTAASSAVESSFDGI